MLTFIDAFSILLAIGMLCIYQALNHMDLDAVYIDLNAIDIKLDTSQRNVDAHMVTDGSS